MATPLDLSRETEIIRLIKLLKGLDFIVVGGYAVDAYTLHRFSIDLDIVINGTDTKTIESLLEGEQYKQGVIKDDFDLTYSGKYKQYLKDRVSVDMLINSLVSRTTMASWSFQTILENSNKRLVKGLTESVEAMVPVKELLISMKLHSGRITDIRDIVMLSDEVDMDKVLNLSKRGDMTILKGIFVKYDELLQSKNFIDSLKGVFSLSTKRRGDRIEASVNKTRKMLEFLRKHI